MLQALNVVGGLGLGLTLLWLFLLTFGSAFSVAVSDGIDGLTAGMASIAGGGMLLSLFVREANSELIAFGGCSPGCVHWAAPLKSAFGLVFHGQRKAARAHLSGR